MPETRHTNQPQSHLIRLGLWVLVAVTALTHGVVEPWSALLFELLVVALLFGWALQVYRARRLTLFIPPILGPLAVWWLVGAAQCVTWVDAAGLRRGLSLDVEATRATLLRLSCLLLCVLLAAFALHGRAAWAQLTRFLPWYGLTLAVLAILQHFTARQSILWIREIDTSMPFGTFVNRDHFAGYMELLLGLPVALIATQYVRGEGRFLYLVATLLMGLALLLTLSRGGTLSLLIELLLIAALTRQRAKHLRAERQPSLPGERGRIEWLGVAAVTLVLAGIIGGIVWIGAEPLIMRLATGSGDVNNPQTFDEARGTIWRDTWLLIKAKPWLGAGLGAYETAFPQYALDENESGGLVAQSHNDYLQVLADTGLVGGVLLLWFLYLVLRAVVASARLRDPLAAGVAIGCSGGVLGMLVHSFFDFNLQLTSHALLFLVLCVVLLSVTATQAELPAPERDVLSLDNEAVLALHG
jgi:O-antigen ligase